MKQPSLKLTALALGTVATLLAAPAHAGKDLDAIKKRGELICGVSTGLAGFSAADSQGKYSGLDVDMCRAVAAAGFACAAVGFAVASTTTSPGPNQGGKSPLPSWGWKRGSASAAAWPGSVRASPRSSPAGSEQRQREFATRHSCTGSGPCSESRCSSTLPTVPVPSTARRRGVYSGLASPRSKPMPRFSSAANAGAPLRAAGAAAPGHRPPADGTHPGASPLACASPRWRTISLCPTL